MSEIFKNIKMSLEEYLRLKNIEKDYFILQDRIDKAIQLLNKHSIDCFEKWYDNNDFSEIMKIILEILKRDSNE